MSEEEIIQGIDDIKHHFFKDIKEQYYIEVINSLLDLYNQEKEKNKKWEDKIKAKMKKYEATGYEEAAGALQELLEEKE